jgi:hypothetical protein
VLCDGARAAVLSDGAFGARAAVLFRVVGARSFEPTPRSASAFDGEGSAADTWQPKLFNAPSASPQSAARWIRQQSKSCTTVH